MSLLTYWQGRSCDIFCNVIDNFGDIGVCWRLARVLVNEYELNVRLWVDDLASFARLLPEIDLLLIDQSLEKIQICYWGKDFSQVEAAELVIEAFACFLPEQYILAMAQRNSIWINLEYLSAEDWVEGCHLLPSPHPSLPLQKYFFFPGFTEKTGGLICESGLFKNLEKVKSAQFCVDVLAQYVPDNGLKISLFSYPNANLELLLDVWVTGPQLIYCFVPEGCLSEQLASYFFDESLTVGSFCQRGSLSLKIIPFLPQSQYDYLLASCDINFVRGEDSFVRAQWVHKPLIWHIYQQDDDVHIVKKDAFLEKYLTGLDEPLVECMTKFWHFWNGQVYVAAEVAEVWQQFVLARYELTLHAQRWAKRQSKHNLAFNLLNFCQKLGTIPPFG